ncbi:aminotransferase class V-fold PLP-dependent enzyme [Hydrogenobacter sp. T-2]|uniref:cysteine desulfurase family protein n=1 Tax=Pampinifervens diazotrophicum TaxID=1632018 RepID=UPI002B26401C|nr:aminotransferase class V-fold PLP-dependent enzyme [Hydrogenobacter sp. T-2]WPM31472.1 aminotransferase class V-fold PLP-dependent enzyme [Hydrogenobacter sp. T-2]
MLLLDPTSSQPLDGAFRQELLSIFFINPTGINSLSTRSKEMLVRSRGVLASFLGCSNLEVIYTSSSTESNNLAIKGYVYGKKGSILTTNFEHISITHPLKGLERQGFEVVYIQTDEKGWVDPQAVAEQVREDTLMVTMGAVCRETSTLRDIKGIVSAVKEVNPNVVCHFDMWGLYYPSISMEELNMASFDGPSLMAPQGVGFLYVKKGIRLKPLIEGGIQERGVRAGEENLFGIYLLSQSVRFLMEKRDEIKKSFEMYDGLVLENLPLPPAFKEGCKAPALFSFGLQGVELEMVISLLERGGFYLNTSTPCMANRRRCGFDHLLSFRLPPLVPIDELERFLYTLRNTLHSIGALT